MDTQRVYSALRKRIDADNGSPELAEEEPDSPKSTDSQGQFVGARAKWKIRKNSSIRKVQSQASVHIMAPDPKHRQFSLQHPAWQNEEGLTPQQMAEHNERMEDKNNRKLATQDAESSFFPFSGASKPKTPSPFKLAMAAAKMEMRSASGSDTGSVIVSRQQDNPLQSAFSNSTESVSVYSRTTNSHVNNLASREWLGPVGADEEAPAGMATIIPARHASKRTLNAGSAHQSQGAQHQQSAEWKSWLQHQSKGLERSASRSSTATHRREHAQIDDTDKDIGPVSGHGMTNARKRSILGGFWSAARTNFLG